MLYAILCYDSEDAVFAWNRQEDAAAMERLGQVQHELRQAGRLRPVARLMPTTAATALRRGTGPPALDGTLPLAAEQEVGIGFRRAAQSCATRKPSNDDSLPPRGRPRRFGAAEPLRA